MADLDSSHNEPRGGSATPGPPDSTVDAAAAAYRHKRAKTSRPTHARRSQAGSEELVALGVRIPRALDNKLAGLIYRLRLDNVKATKAELVALALEDLPDDPTAAMIERLERQ